MELLSILYTEHDIVHNTCGTCNDLCCNCVVMTFIMYSHIYTLWRKSIFFSSQSILPSCLLCVFTRNTLLATAEATVELLLHKNVSKESSACVTRTSSLLSDTSSTS